MLTDEDKPTPPAAADRRQLVGGLGPRRAPWAGGPSLGLMAVDDELLNKVTWKIPNALVLVGSGRATSATP